MNNPTSTRREFCTLFAGISAHLLTRRSCFAWKATLTTSVIDPADAFRSPPESARPYVLWHWMGSNVSESGITRDLEAMKESGIGGATIYSLSDTTIPWAYTILNSPTPNIVAFSDVWWAMIRHAAIEAHRLGIELMLHNCAGYESSGGTWITPELSMQEVIWSERKITGPSTFTGELERPTVDPHPHAPFPNVFIPSEGKLASPIVQGRKNYYRDIAVLAIPSGNVVPKDKIFDLSTKMNTRGQLEWDVPVGDWTVYRFGHTTTGAMIQPAQWDAMGLECDKMSAEAVSFHMQHVLGQIKKYLGDLTGSGLTTLFFDSYEAGTPTWTPRMREEFQNRRGYELTPWLPVLAGRIISTEKDTTIFQQDFAQTISDLYRDCYWATLSVGAHSAGLRVAAEPYGGPWDISQAVRYLDTSWVEFWTHYNPASSSFLEGCSPVAETAHALGNSLIAGEAFTTGPEHYRWNEHPAMLKRVGDAAFCTGVNRLNIHDFVHQPWDSKYRPGNVMGQWGIHLGRYQTWWKPGKAWITYLWRCQALLQTGIWIAPSPESSMSYPATENSTVRRIFGGPELKSVRRRQGSTDIYFVANVAATGGSVRCSFPVHDRQPELWDPVWGTMRDLSEFQQEGERVIVPLDFAPAQSFFVIFRKEAVKTNAGDVNFPALTLVAEVDGSWEVSFDPDWGGPASVLFESLKDWSKDDNPAIRYYSGTSIYKKAVNVADLPRGRRLYLELGEVKNIAEVNLNGESLGTVWTAPWRIDITHAVQLGKNDLEIAVTNVWVNRLIGDEQQPSDIVWQIGDPKINSGSFMKELPAWFLKGEARPSRERYTFTTWNFFTKDSPLESSGLLGPVRIMVSE
jgi:hypothetical protein